MKSKTLLLVIGALAVKHKKCSFSYKKQSIDRLKKLYAIYLKLKNQEQVRRKLWVRDIFLEEQRLLQGASSNLVEELREKDREKYYNFLRLYPETFDELLLLVGPKIAKQDFLRQSLSAKIRLEVTFRYLASGDSMTSLSYMFRIGKNTVSEIIAETCQAIWDSLKDIVFMQPLEENWRKIAQQFDEKWNFKNCIGAVDGKHVIMQAPPNSGSTLYNYKGSHSINLLAIVDANYQFIMVDIGSAGRNSDSGIFRNSKLGQGFDQKLFNVPDPENNFPYVLVADVAFPLTEYMMRPYPRRGNLDMPKKIFNYRLSRARRIVESAFGILASTWRIFRKPIIANQVTVRKIVQACVCLHNFVLMKKQSGSNRQVGQDLSDVNINLQHQALVDISKCGSNTYTRNAALIREQFTDFFCRTGAVNWQWQKALQNVF